MKLAATLSLLLAMVLGIWVTVDYSHNYQMQQVNLEGMRYRLAHGAAAGGIAEDVNQVDDAEKWDGIVGVAAFVALIASIVMFSQGRKTRSSS